MWTDASVTNLTDETFSREVLSAALPAAVFFRTDWSGWSHIMEPVVERLARETAGALKVCRVDADHAPATARRYSVRSVPALLFFVAGSVIARRDGPVPAGEITDLQQAIARVVAAEEAG